MLNISQKLILGMDKSSLKRQRGILLVTAVLLLISGIFCLINPFISGMTLSVIVGICLAFSGILMIIGMIANRPNNFWPTVAGILLGLAYLFIGYAFIADPVSGILGLALFLGILFAIGGIIRLVVGIKTFGQPGCWFQISLGILDLIIAYLLIAAGPVSSMTMVTTIVGIEMLFSAFSCFNLASLFKQQVK